MDNEDLNKAEFVEWLKAFTKQQALRSVNLYRQIPKTEEARVLGRQFIRPATSVGANYRAVCSARSKAEYFSKLSICVEEADESIIWPELFAEAGIFPHAKLQPLMSDFGLVLSILSKARKSSS